MPKSMSHVVVLTDDLEGVLSFLRDVARNDAPVNRYEIAASTASELFGWPLEHAAAVGAFVGEGPGSLDLVAIPEALRGRVTPGVKLLAYMTRDSAASGVAAAAVGAAVRGPFHAISAADNPMSFVEAVVGGVPFELVQFGG